MPEVYGSAHFETARDKVVARLTALRDAMAIDYSPKFTHVHERHNVADLKLNAVTVGLEDAVQENRGNRGSDIIIDNELTFKIRIHTAYADGIADDQVTARLCNSVCNHLRSKYDLGDGYHMTVGTSITANNQFDESATLGGELQVTVLFVSEHAQS